MWVHAFVGGFFLGGGDSFFIYFKSLVKISELKNIPDFIFFFLVETKLIEFKNMHLQYIENEYKKLGNKPWGIYQSFSWITKI